MSPQKSRRFVRLLGGGASVAVACIPEWHARLSSSRNPNPSRAVIAKSLREIPAVARIHKNVTPSNNTPDCGVIRTRCEKSENRHLLTATTAENLVLALLKIHRRGRYRKAAISPPTANLEGAGLPLDARLSYGHALLRPSGALC